MVDYSVVNSLIQIAWCCFWLSKYLLKLKYPHWRECCFLPPWGEGNSLCNSICLAKQKTGPALTDAGAWHHMRGRRRRSRDTMWRGRFQQCRRSSSSTSTMSISVCLRRISNLPGRSDRKVELTFRGQWLGSLQPELETSQHGWWRRGRIFCGGFFCCFFLTPPQQHNVWTVTLSYFPASQFSQSVTLRSAYSLLVFAPYEMEKVHKSHALWLEAEAEHFQRPI